MNCTDFTYYVTLMAKRTCAPLHHPLKLPLSAWLSCTNSSHQDGFMLRLTVPLISNFTLAIARLNVALHVSYESRE